MKTNKILLVLFMAIAMVSCKKDSDKTTEDATTVENTSTAVTFTLNAIVQQDDDFQIFYKEDGNMETQFDEVTSIWSGVKGSTTAQDIVFKLPEDAYPTNLRFDFGSNKKQPEITINSFTMSYKGKTLVVKGADFFNYFIADPALVKIDPATAKVTPVLSANGTYYDPLFLSSEKLNAEMLKLGQ